jgi:hypothetical protein
MSGEPRPRGPSAVTAAGRGFSAALAIVPVERLAEGSAAPTRLVRKARPGHHGTLASRWTVRGVRFVIDQRTGSRIAGSGAARHEMRPTWTLELSDRGPVEWRLIASSNPVDGLQFFSEIYRR